MLHFKMSSEFILLTSMIMIKVRGNACHHVACRIPSQVCYCNERFNCEEMQEREREGE